MRCKYTRIGYHNIIKEEDICFKIHMGLAGSRNYVPAVISEKVLIVVTEEETGFPGSTVMRKGDPGTCMTPSATLISWIPALQIT